MPIDRARHTKDGPVGKKVATYFGDLLRQQKVAVEGPIGGDFDWCLYITNTELIIRVGWVAPKEGDDDLWALDVDVYHNLRERILRNSRGQEALPALLAVVRNILGNAQDLGLVKDLRWLTRVDFETHFES